MPARPARAAKRRAKRRLDSSQGDSENDSPQPASKRRRSDSASGSQSSTKSNQSRRGRKRPQRHSQESESDEENRPPAKKRRVQPSDSQSQSSQQSKAGGGRRSRRRVRARPATDDDASVSVPPRGDSISAATAEASKRAEIVIQWVNGGESLKNKMETIKDWLVEDEEGFSLMMVHVMLRLSGTRTYKLPRAQLEAPSSTEGDVKEIVKEIEESFEEAESDDEKDDEEKEEEKMDEEPATRGRKRKKKTGPVQPELFAKGQNKLLPRYKQFITLVADKCISTVFDDDYFYDLFLQWCTMLARNAFRRQLRRVAVHTAFYMMDGLVPHLASTRKDLLRTTRQLENQENTRKRGNKQKEMEEQTDRLKTIQDLTDIVLKQIVAYKYADTDPHIRELVLRHIPIWVNMDPCKQYLLANVWIKYLSWGLHDSDSSVRKAGIDGLDKLFHYNKRKRSKKSQNKSSSDTVDEERLNALSALLNRYKGRILEMSRDIDPEVCANAIGLMTTLLRNQLLNTGEGDDVADCIFDEDASVREAAAEFIYADSFEYIGEDEYDSLGDKHREDLKQICNLVRDRNISLCQTFGSAGSSRSFFEPAAFVVNELWTKCDCLRDWDSMINLLLETEQSENARNQKNMRKTKKNQTESKVVEWEQNALCYILLACVKKACQSLEETVSFGRKKSKKKARKRDEELASKWFDEFEENGAPRIGDLLKTFQADSIKCYAIVQMVQHIPLTIFEAQENRPTLDTIIDTLSKIFLVHETPMLNQLELDGNDEKQEFEESLETVHLITTKFHKNRVNRELQHEVMNALQFLANEQHTYQEPVQDAILEIVDQVADRIEDLRESFLERCQSHDGEEDSKIDPQEQELILSMFSSLTRLQHVCTGVKAAKWEWNENFTELLRVITQSSVEEYQEFLTPLCAMLFADVSWMFEGMSESEDFEFEQKLRERIELIQETINIMTEAAYSWLEDGGAEIPYLTTTEGKLIEENVGKLVDVLSIIHIRVRKSQRLRDNLEHVFPQKLCDNLANFYRETLLFLHKTNTNKAEESSATQNVENTDPTAVFVRENMEIRSLVRCSRIGIIAPYNGIKMGAIALSFIRRGSGKSKDKKWRQRHRDVLDGFYKRFTNLDESHRNDMCYDAMVEILKHEPEESRQSALDTFCHLMQQKQSGFNKKRQGLFTNLVELCFNNILIKDGALELLPLLPPLVRFLRLCVNRDVLKLWQAFKSVESNLPKNRGNDENWELFDKFREDFHEMVKKSRQRRQMNVDSDDEVSQTEEQDEPQNEGGGDDGSQVFDNTQQSHNFDAPDQKDMNVDEDAPRMSRGIRSQDEEDDESDAEMEDPQPKQSIASSKGVESDQEESPASQPKSRGRRGRGRGRGRGKGRGRPKGKQTPRGAWVKRKKRT